MKDERNVRYCRAAGRKCRPVAFILAVMLMAVSIPLFGLSAFAAEDTGGPVDVEKPCSLTVKLNAPTDQDKEMLEQANVVIDIYRVGNAVKDPTYDTYHWEPIDMLKGRLELPHDTDRAGWRKVTEAATDLYLGTAPEGQSQWNPDQIPGAMKNAISNVDGDDCLKIEGRTIGEKVEGLKAGIYLVIPHGSNITNYAAVNKAALTSDDNAAADSTAAEAAADSSLMPRTVLLARSSRRTYQFSPELIAVPTKDPDPETGEINTANRGAWDYDPELFLKPAQLGVGGDLEIIKDLSTYEIRKKNNLEGVERDVIDDATFVFEVTAYESQEAYNNLGAGAPVIYHDFVSIEFNDASSKSALVRDIPVGSYVIVTEVYSGRSYSATVDSTQTATIEPDEPVGVNFSNDYNAIHGGGGSFTNNFKYGDSGWEISRVSDNSSESETVKEFTGKK